MNAGPGHPDGEEPTLQRLRGRYLVRNPAWNAWLRVADSLAAALPRRDGRRAGDTRRVLIAVGGHLGDAVVATSVLPVIRRSLPDAEIGVLAPSWSAVVFEGHPAIRRFHAADHWKTSRSRASLLTRWRTYRRGAAQAVREMHEARYDLAVDLYPYYPNAAPLLWRAGIPVRVGFDSGGYGPLYTHARPWTDGGRHTADRHFELLRAAGLSIGMTQPEYDLPPVADPARERATTMLRLAGVDPVDFIVVHMGAGNPLKEWPIDHWRAVASGIAADGGRIVFTGAGAHDVELATRLLPDVSGAVSLCDRLGWPEFRAVLSQAHLVLSVDTVAAHVAAAEGVPGIIVMGPLGEPDHWRPLGQTTTILRDHVPGVRRPRVDPRRADGCSTGITPAMVLDAVRARMQEAGHGR